MKHNQQYWDNIISILDDTCQEARIGMQLVMNSTLNGLRIKLSNLQNNRHSQPSQLSQQSQSEEGKSG
jgi:hypothetical protein